MSHQYDVKMMSQINFATLNRHCNVILISHPCMIGASDGGINLPVN